MALSDMSPTTPPEGASAVPVWHTPPDVPALGAGATSSSAVDALGFSSELPAPFEAPLPPDEGPAPTTEDSAMRGDTDSTLGFGTAPGSPVDGGRRSDVKAFEASELPLQAAAAAATEPPFSRLAGVTAGTGALEDGGAAFPIIGASSAAPSLEHSSDAEIGGGLVLDDAGNMPQVGVMVDGMDDVEDIFGFDMPDDGAAGATAMNDDLLPVTTANGHTGEAGIAMHLDGGDAVVNLDLSDDDAGAASAAVLLSEIGVRSNDELDRVFEDLEASPGEDVPRDAEMTAVANLPSASFDEIETVTPDAPQAPAPGAEDMPKLKGEVEVLDLDDPETEAMLEARRQKIAEVQDRQRVQLAMTRMHAQMAFGRMPIGRPGNSHADRDVVVINSDDDDDLIEVEDNYSNPHNTYDNVYSNIATVGEVFGASHPSSLYPPQNGAGPHGGYGMDGTNFSYRPAAPSYVKPQEFDKNTIKKLVENNNMSADATEEHDDPPELTVSLLRHQKRAVAWMIKRETQGAAPVIDNVAQNGDGMGFTGERPHVSGGNDSESDDENSPSSSNGSTQCLGGILADEQGLGKTLSVVALMLANPPPPEDGKPSKWRTLIVCPVSLVGQWKEEIEQRIDPEHRPSIYIYHGPKRTRDPAKLAEYDVVITTYTTLTNEYPKVLKNDPSYAALKKAKLPVPRRAGGPIYGCSWFRAVLDESHQIKNRRTEGWAAAGHLPAARRWCLTGTPIQNSVDDIYSLFCFIRYRFLEKNTYKSWNERWKKKLESSDERTRMRTFKRFQTIVAVVTLRRTKLDKIEGKELIALPPRNAEVRETQFLLPAESDLYKALKENSHSELNKYAASAGGLKQNYTGIMLLLLRLRQACCHPFLSEYSSSKRRGVNGAGDSTFVSPYSVEDLDKSQQLIEAGVSSFDMLAPETQDGMMVKLAPPPPGQALSPTPDLFPCGVCSHHLPVLSLRLLAAGNVICRSCASGILATHTSGKPEDDPFLELDDVRREVHVKVRMSRWIATGKGSKSGDKRVKLEESAPTGGAAKRPKAVKPPRKKADDKAKDEATVPELNPKIRLPSTKMKIMLEVLTAMRERNPEEKCLVFSQWTSMLDIIAVHVGDAGFKACRLDGTMSMLKRKEQVDKFRSDKEVTVFLLSMHAAGTGLNLTEANNVILADAWWNPSVEAQCCDRAHRIGQKREVRITRLKIAGTCEEKIYQLCARKAETCASALGESGGKSIGRQKLTLQDALSLFGDADDTPSVPLGADADAATREAAIGVGHILGGGSGYDAGPPG